MGDAVISTDALGMINSYNGAALDILDTNETLSGRNLSEYLNLSDSKGNDVDLIAFTSKVDHNLKRRDIIHTYEDGEKINLYVNATPVKVGYGEDSRSGFTIIMRDISKFL